MYLTEDEARQKWCPHARVPLAADGYTGNRMDDTTGAIVPEFGSRCIASQCMAWRWASLPVADTDDNPAEKGYCGAFGRPE